jgi:metal-responsive CopG/Arc/MetJ family transcriptional regulator
MTEVVSFKVDRALLIRIDGLTSNRSDFIRQAIEEKVRRAGRKEHSTWDALGRTEQLNIRIRSAPGKVRRIDL